MFGNKKKDLEKQILDQAALIADLQRAQGEVLTEEQKIKAEIQRRAEIIAKEHWEKEVAFKSLTTSDLHLPIIYDLVKSAQLVGKVVIKLADGTEIQVYPDKERDQLNQLASNLY